jgi:hypothetical protein
MTQQAARGDDRGEVRMHCVAPIYDGKLEDFKRLAQDLLSTIREKDPDALNHLARGPAATAVMIGERITDFIKTNAGPIMNQPIEEHAK